LPKLLYKTSLYELTNRDFTEIIKRLQAILKANRIKVFKKFLMTGTVQKIHFCKNFILTFPNAIALTEIFKSSLYKLDTHQTNYTNKGRDVKFHVKSYEIAFYDKIAEINKTRYGKAFIKKHGLSNINILRAVAVDAIDRLQRTFNEVPLLESLRKKDKIEFVL
jgi:hypothetical protein